MYAPTAKQEEFHACTQPNVVYIGSRGTGKSLALRFEAHARALATPNYRYAILGLSNPDLEKNHLGFIQDEMKKFGGSFHQTKKIAYYPNGSIGFYSHCGDNGDGLGNMLGAEVYWLGVDELCSVNWDLFRKVSVSVRVPLKKQEQGIRAMIRGATNPAGMSVDRVYSYFIDKDVENDVDYVPSDWHHVHTLPKDNPHMPEAEYRKMFAGLPPHLLKAWRDGERASEDQLFFLKPEHFAASYPDLRGAHIYRCMDFGQFDATVCLWVAVYPNGRALVFKERSWVNPNIREISKQIINESHGMRVVETYCDPTMFRYQQATGYNSVGDQIEACGIPLTKSANDRSAYVTSISQYVYTTLPDGLPRLQIFAPNCPMLTKTLPIMRADPKDPNKMANSSQDHWPVALSYFCQGAIAIPQIHMPQQGDSRVLELIRKAKQHR